MTHCSVEALPLLVLQELVCGQGHSLKRSKVSVSVNWSKGWKGHKSHQLHITYQGSQKQDDHHDNPCALHFDRVGFGQFQDLLHLISRIFRGK